MTKAKRPGTCYPTLEANLLYQYHGLIPPYHLGRYTRPRRSYLKEYTKPKDRDVSPWKKWVDYYLP